MASLLLERRPVSRVFVTLRDHKAPPPLGEALDMRDSHPADSIADRLITLRGYDASLPTYREQKRLNGLELI